MLANADFTELLARNTPERLCKRMFERNAARIGVKKPQVAVPNLLRIVEAMLKLSNRQGFHATSLRDLADLSGLSMGGMYSYIGSKDALLVMILEEVDAAVSELLSLPPADIRADPRAHLRWIIEGHVRLTELMQPWFVFVYMEAKAFPQKAKRAAIESELRTEHEIASVLESGKAHGLFRVDDVGLTAALIKPLLQDWYVKRAKYRRGGTTIDAYIAQLESFLAGALEVTDKNEAQKRSLAGR
jgi:AcrR family transcriptional regulator